LLLNKYYLVFSKPGGGKQSESESEEKGSVRVSVSPPVAKHTLTLFVSGIVPVRDR